MNAIKDKEKLTTFFESFFKKHPIENDIFIIEANGKHFIFENDTVIDMIKHFDQKQQDYIRRQLQLYNYLNQDLSICLIQIACDYVRTLVREHEKEDCKILPLQSIYNLN
ncbi:hypothetical protein P4J13_21085 [Bacillus anthracis]|uniref:hypothetical protein n=1 Tax=Bacillus anthracis TaxID=1392 RepID=UPI002DB6A8C0|nr:hypothetical protein [Bacillus anthracis]MEB9506431.1 hypothetical protein [Bacillus anthracis]